MCAARPDAARLPASHVALDPAGRMATATGRSRWTRHQAAPLEGMGCALAQGSHFSRPVAADAVSAWLDAAPPVADAPAGGWALAAV